MIGDLLIRVAKKEPLSEQDKQYLRLWMNQAESNNIFVNGTQNGQGDIYADNVNALSGEFTFPPYGLSSKIIFEATVPSGTPGSVNVTFTEKVYDELGGFTALSNYFRVPFRAKYQFGVFVDWQPYSGGYRTHSLGVYGRGNIVEVSGRDHSSEAESLTTSGSEEASVPSGALMLVTCTIPNIGVPLTCTGTFTARLLRTHDGDGYS